jgi:hypothetical protein
VVCPIGIASVISKNMWLDGMTAVTSMPEREYCNSVIRERLVGETLACSFRTN